MKPKTIFHRRKSQVFRICDITIVSVSFFIIAWIKPATIDVVIPKYLGPFFCFLALWVLTSILTKKSNFQGKKSLRSKLSSIIIANTIILAVTLSLITLFEIANISRLMIFGTIGLATILEIVLSWQLIVFQKINRLFFFEGKIEERINIIEDQQKTAKLTNGFSSSIKSNIVRLHSNALYDFINTNIPLPENKIQFIASRRAFNIETIIGNPKAIVNLETLNNVKDINSLISASNLKISQGGLLFSIAETTESRKKRILSKYPVILNQTIYIIDYLYHRVFAKMYPTRYLYRMLKHRNRAISKAELLGRLYAMGFEVIVDTEIDGKYACVTKKIDIPKQIDNEAIGGIIRLKRLGESGKTIGVYKFRTMSPYSEYIQAYIHQKNSLQDGGKIKDDFRINSLGRFMRRTWIDELPMLLNIIKGEMKLVGVRPLSQHYFSLYTEELQDLRITTKPGLLPPFYADSPVTLDEIMESEMRYIRAYKEHPLRTDLRYLSKIAFNILIKKKRSN